MKILNACLGVGGMLLLGLAAACGGGGSDAGGDDVTLDPADAVELAHAALVAPGDLPGSGWEVTQEDSFSDDDEPPFESEACVAITEKMNAATDGSEEHRAGRAQRTISRQGPNDILPTEIDVSVNVFDNVDAPKDAMKAFADVLGSSDFKDCFTNGLKESVETDGVTVDAKVVDASAKAPFGGEASGFDFHIEAGGEELDMRIEYYVWRWGNVGVTVGVNGQDLPDGFVEEVVAAIDGKIQATGE
jgi:hypothetical protein